MMLDKVISNAILLSHNSIEGDVYVHTLNL